MKRLPFPGSQETGSKIVVLLIIFLVIVVTLVLICFCKRKCCSSNSAERNQSAPTNVPDGLVPEEEELPPPEPPAPRPTNPTLIRLDSIPTYSECITASDRVVSNNDYVSLPTEEELDGLPGVAPPSYEEVQEHGELYGEVTMANTAV